MNELFGTEDMPSPMEAWRRKYKIDTYQFPDGWVAVVGNSGTKGEGRTREEALMNWATVSEVPCWKSEQMGGSK